MPEFGKLLSGFRVFKTTTFAEQKDLISHLIQLGEKPTTLVIACVDLRIAPQMLFATNPGELYVVNNIGGLVPRSDETGVHGIMSAIEYAITELEVQNILVLGHARCDGIKAMMSDKFTAASDGLSESMKKWLSIAREARDSVKLQLPNSSAEEQQAAEALATEENTETRNVLHQHYPYSLNIARPKNNSLCWNLFKKISVIH